MRGLPPVPADVARLEQDFDIDGHTVSVGFWLLGGSLIGATPPELDAIVAMWLVTGLPELLQLQHSECQGTTCRLGVGGLNVVRAAPPNHGAWTGGQADQVALGLKWQTLSRGRQGWALTYVPGVPSRFVDAHYRINQTAWGNLLDAGSHLLAALNALPAPDGSSLVVGTVHTSRAGIPLPAAVFDPYIGVVPTAKLVTIRRRIPSGGGLSPAP